MKIDPTKVEWNQSALLHINVGDSRAQLLAWEQQRDRASRMLHNDLGQALTAAILNLEYWCDSPLPDVERLAAVDELKRALSVARGLSMELRSPVLARGGLLPALESLVASFPKEGAPGCLIESEDLGAGIPQAVEVYIFHMLQVAMDNVVKHAHARDMLIRLTTDTRELIAEVLDDGIGFDLATLRAIDGLCGLARIGQISRLLGGSARIFSVPQLGCAIQMRVPLDQANPNMSRGRKEVA